MDRGARLKRVLLVLATGTPLLIGAGGCLSSTIQRILVGIVV